jgi:hypothetical protein
MKQQFQDTIFNCLQLVLVGIYSYNQLVPLFLEIWSFQSNNISVKEEVHTLMFNACCGGCYNTSLLPQELIFQARYCDGEVDDGDFDADLRQVVRIRHFTCHVKPVTKCQVNPREY